MSTHLDHHDAELLLRLYELRREEKLRKAREWFFAEPLPDSMEDLMKRYPPGSKENAYSRMVTSYWEMAASILNHGLINEDLFFENSGELWGVWIKIEPMASTFRAMAKDPYANKNLETAAKKYEAWMEKRSPGAMAVRRTFLQAVAASGMQNK